MHDVGAWAAAAVVWVRGDTHACAAFATSRAVVVAQRTDDDIVLVRHGKRPRERGSWRHLSLQHLSGRGAAAGQPLAVDGGSWMKLYEASGSSSERVWELPGDGGTRRSRRGAWWRQAQSTKHSSGSLRQTVRGLALKEDRVSGGGGDEDWRGGED